MENHSFKDILRILHFRRDSHNTMKDSNNQDFLQNSILLITQEYHLTKDLLHLLEKKGIILLRKQWDQERLRKTILEKVGASFKRSILVEKGNQWNLNLLLPSIYFNEL